MNFRVKMLVNVRKSVRGKVVVVLEEGETCSATHGNPGETYVFSKKYGKHFKVGINDFIRLQIGP